MSEFILIPYFTLPSYMLNSIDKNALPSSEAQLRDQ